MLAAIDSVTRAHFKAWGGFVTLEAKADSRFIYNNELSAKFHGYKHPEDSIGHSTKDTKSDVAECYETFHRYNQQVINSGVSLEIFDVHPDTEGKWHAWLGKRMPFYANQEEPEIIGVLYHGDEITCQASLALAEQLAPRRGQWQGSYLVGCQALPIDLSRAQHHFLFWYLQGLSLPDIGAKLALNAPCCAQQLRTLQYCFAVRSPQQLRERAISLGYAQRIPSALLHPLRLKVALCPTN